MLWYKSWTDTRWRFLLVLALLVAGACLTVSSFRLVQQLLASLQLQQLTDSTLQTLPGGDALRESVRESLELARTFRGYAWSEWFASDFPFWLTLAAAVLGSGSPLVKSGNGTFFLLALPVARERWIATRAVVGVVELFVLALLPSVAVAALAPLVGEQLALVEALVYGLCAFVVASLFFGLATFFSALFSDVWRPLLITSLAAVVLAAIGMLLPEDRGLFRAMGGGNYFYGGSLPWAELAVSAAAAAGLIYAAAAAVAHRDF